MLLARLKKILEARQHFVGAGEEPIAWWKSPMARSPMTAMHAAAMLPQTTKVVDVVADTAEGVAIET
eukprot:2154484-Ditylum_brightwellii.AAC.1